MSIAGGSHVSRECTPRHGQRTLPLYSTEAVGKAGVITVGGLMLGPSKTRDLDRPVLIAIESYVPKDHLYRHLHRVLDLSFVRDLAADCYAAGGRPSIDPEVFFRLHLLMFFAGIRSERQLLEQASYNLAMRWYAGYNLDEPL